jgi:hypothetical protein
MTTIVVEDGSIVASANSYVSAADLSTYATDRGITINGTAAVLLIQAMDYLEQQDFQGYKYTDDQALQWPRGDVYIDGYYVSVSTIPQSLIDAQCEIALAIDGGDNPLANVERETTSETVGPISVTYSSNAFPATYLTAVANKLKKLLKPGSSLANAVVTRA